MKPRRQSHLKLLAGLVLAAGARSAMGQNWVTSQSETHWLQLNPDYASVGIFAEDYNQRISSSGGSYEQKRTFYGPSMTLGLSGSVYHPNLLEYRLALDGSMGSMEETYGGAAGGGRISQTRYLGSFAGEVHLLDNKPFHARLSANYAHHYQDYDFFNRVYLDTIRYGGVLFYTKGRWSFTSSLYQVTEDGRQNYYVRTSDTQLASFDATHRRRSGSTTLSASASQYARNDAGLASNGSDYGFGISDSEGFGDKGRYHSIVSAYYSHLENDFLPSDLYNVMGNLRMDHTDRLLSQHTLNYSRNAYANSQNQNINGSSSIQHRLFDSLTSSLAVSGYRYSASTGPNTQNAWQLGVNPGVNYTKRLSSSSSLTAYESFGLYHTDMQSSGGVLSADETHSFGTDPGGFFLLRQGNVIASSIILSSGPNGSGTVYNPVVDGYEVVLNGQLIMIRRLPGSTVPDSVHVHYQYDSNPSGAYDTMNNACGIRLDFFNNHWSVYARMNNSRSSGDANVFLQNLNDMVVGTEMNWRFLRAGAEYEIYDSNLSPYSAMRAFQSFTFRAADYSTFNLHFSETFLSYDRAGRSEQNYRAVLRYNQRFTRSLNLSVELGANQRMGDGVEQTLAVFRPELRYTMGSLSVSAGYEYGYDEYLSSLKRVNNRAFIRIQKSF